MKLFDRFYPDKYVGSTYHIDFKKLYQKGYRGILFDIDNTLVPHGAAPDKRAIELFSELRKIGFKICLISNNRIERVNSFNDVVKAEFIHDAHKPSVKAYEKAMEILNTNKKNTIFIGDQIFTDIYGANRAGLATILVKPIHPKEEIQIVFKRYLEKIVLYFYKRKRRTKIETNRRV